jgi:hypothetical protein
MLLLGLISAHLCLGVIGCVWGAWSHWTQHKQPNLLAAALVLSAAFFPIAWFTFTAPLLKLFSVQRVY